MADPKLAWLVDDDEEMASAVALMLKLLGYQARGFLDAPSAAQALLAGQPCDMILLDLNMPQVSGKDFLEFVRQRNEFAGLPVVMLTSEFNELIMDELLRAGADGYVTKPVSLTELEQAVAAAIQARGAE